MDRRAPRASGQSALLRPVGPRPARVYWTRRLVLLAAVVLVVVFGAKACGGDRTTPTGASAPRPSVTSTPTTSPSPVKITTCHKRDLTVTAATDVASYPAGSLPRLSAVVRNVSDRACRFSTAPGERVWTIVSGADRVWTSTDCTRPGGRATTRLRPGKTIAYALVWNRRRSATGCPTDTPEASRGTYQLAVTVDGVAAETVVFHLTG